MSFVPARTPTPPSDTLAPTPGAHAILEDWRERGNALPPGAALGILREVPEAVRRAVRSYLLCAAASEGLTSTPRGEPYDERHLWRVAYALTDEQWATCLEHACQASAWLTQKEDA